MDTVTTTVEAPSLRGIVLGAHRRFRRGLEARCAALKGLTVADSDSIRGATDKGPGQSLMQMHLAEMTTLGKLLDRLGPPANVPETDIRGYLRAFRKDVQLQLDTTTHDLYDKARAHLFVSMSTDDLCKSRLAAARAHGERDGARFALAQFDEVFGPLCRAGLVK